MTEINRFHLYISSSLRNTGSIEDFTYILKRPILLSNSHHYFKVIVKEVTIPFTFQQITNNYNSFSYKLIRNSIDYGVRTITITNGNYNILTLIEEVKKKLLADIAIYLPTYQPTLNFTYDKDQMFVTFSFTADVTDTSFTIYPIQNNVPTMMGVTDTITFYSVGGVVTTASSNQPVNVNVVTSLFIRSSSLKQSDLSRENVINNDDSSDILLQVPILTQPTSWIFYTNELNIENRVLNTTINDINLYLSDTRNYTLDLRGIDWSCVVTIIEYQPAEESHLAQVRYNMRNDTTSLADSMEQVPLKMGVPQVKEIKNERIEIPTNFGVSRLDS